jgi:hypothetical protein
MASATTVTMIALNLILPQSGAVTGRPEKRNPLGRCTGFTPRFWTILDSIYARARGECELGTLAIGKRCQERISATGWAW